MEKETKGTVTSLASLFPAEEAKKASKRVDNAIAEKQKELDQLQRFSSENTNLVKQVKRLPDELFHDVMVPFGKAAFFPGRLIHTNEFLVLLGEGYYAERTSKQTIDILKRRGNVLNSQFDSLKAMMLDLKAEASFFDTTASEAEEGLVEIRENYDEELHGRMSNQAGFSKSMESSEDTSLKVAEDEAYDQVMEKLDELEREELMQKLDELEREELAAETVNDDDDDDDEDEDKDEDEDEDEDVEADFGSSLIQQCFNSGSKTSEFVNSRDQHMPKDVSLNRNNLANVNAMEKPLLRPVSSERNRETSSPKIESSGATPKASVVSQKVSTTTSSKISDNSKAFTGSVVEHAHGLQSHLAGQNSKSSQSSGSNPSKPVSRFKMQKGGR